MRTRPARRTGVSKPTHHVGIECAVIFALKHALERGNMHTGERESLRTCDSTENFPNGFVGIKVSVWSERSRCAVSVGHGQLY